MIRELYNPHLNISVLRKGVSVNFFIYLSFVIHAGKLSTKSEKALQEKGRDGEREEMKEKETERTFGSIGRGFIDLKNH